MELQPKLELEHPPGFDPSNDRIRDNMTIQAMVSQLRVTHIWEDFDKLEEVLLRKEERVNRKIEQLQEQLEMERLAKLHAEKEFKKREEMCEKGKKIKEAYETLLKNIKTSKSFERETIVELRKKNGELETEVLKLSKLKRKLVVVSDATVELRKMNGELKSEVLELRKLMENLVVVSDANAELRKMTGELEREVLELRKLKEKWVKVSDVNAELTEKNGELKTQVWELRKLKRKCSIENTELKSRICVLEGDKHTWAVIESKNGELEEEVKRNLTTIDELRKENRKLEEEKGKYYKQVQSLSRKFEELQGRIVKLEDLTEHLMGTNASGAGHSEEDLSANNGFNHRDDGDVRDNEFGNHNGEVSLQRNGDIRHSLGAAAGTAQTPSKGNNDAKGSSLARGKLESQKVIEIIDLEDDEDDDDDECTSRVLHGKNAGFGITVKTEHPSSSVEIQQKNSFSKQALNMKKRNFFFSDSDESTSTSSPVGSLNLDDLPFSPAQLQAKRRKT